MTAQHPAAPERTCGPCDRGQHGVCDRNEFLRCDCTHGVPAAPETERLHVLIDNGEDALQTCTGCDWESWDAAPSFADHIPAAPETETDANGLRELLAAATPGPWQHFGDHLVWPSERGPAANDPIAEVSEEHQECAALIVAAVNALPALLADLDAARERVRVVEGERDAWKRERDEYVSSICFETTCTNCAHMLDQLASTQELEDGDHIEAAKSQRIKAQQGALAILRTDRNHWRSRAESAEAEREALMQQQPFRVAESNRLRAEFAEAAHEAEKAAHERLRAETEKKAALYSQFADREMDPERRKWLTAFVGTLRSLLGGGEAR